MSPPLLCFLFHWFLQGSRCLSGNHWKPSVPKIWRHGQACSTTSLWNYELLGANSSWASHMEMLSAAVFLQHCKDLSAPLSVYWGACSTSIQCGNPWGQKAKLVSLNRKYQVPTSKTALKVSGTYELQKQLDGKVRFPQSLFLIYAPFSYGPTVAPNQDVSGKQIKSSSV